MTPPAAEPRTTPAASSSPTSPTDTTTTAEGIRVTPLTFAKTADRETRSATSTPTGNGTRFGSAGTAGGEPPPSDPLDDESPGSGSTRSAFEVDDDEGPPLGKLKLGKRPLEDVFRGLVLGASFAAFQRFATTEAERAAGVWLMEEDDAAEISDPIAAIAKRHSGGALVNPDAGDLIRAGVAAAAYLIGNTVDAVRIRWSLRRARKAGLATQPEEEQESQ